MKVNRGMAVVVGVVVGLFGVHLQAELLTTFSIRSLTVEADVIVVGEPLDAPENSISTRYRVAEVLLGPQDLPGTTIVIEEPRCSDGALYCRRSIWDELEKSPPPLPPIRKALLFLKRLPEAEVRTEPAEYRLISSGVRAIDKNQAILVPEQDNNPGPYILTPDKNVTWDRMLTPVREDLPRIAEIRALEQIPDRTRRNDAILRWLDEHRSELGPGGRRTSMNWGTLQEAMFDWVFESGDADASWKILALESDAESFPRDRFGAFCTPEGRRLLLERVLDPSQSDHHRWIAALHLADHTALRPPYQTHLPDRRGLTGEEQARLIDRLIPQLELKDPHGRLCAAFCLRYLCLESPKGPDQESSHRHRATPALTARFRTERHPQVRRHLIEVIRALEDAAFWERLTGDPEEITVLIYDHHPHLETIELQVGLYQTQVQITEAPQLHLEQLTDEGTVAETRTLQPKMRFYAGDSSTIWNQSNGVTLKAPRGDLPVGRWRATLVGEYGERTWTSDPTEIVLADPAEAPISPLLAPSSFRQSSARDRAGVGR